MRHQHHRARTFGALAIATASGLLLAACGNSTDNSIERGAAELEPTNEATTAGEPTNGTIGMRIINNSTTTITDLANFTVTPGWSDPGQAPSMSLPAGETYEFTVPAVLGTDGAVAAGTVTGVFNVEGGGTVTLTGITNPSGVTRATCDTSAPTIACGEADVVGDIDGGWGFASFAFTLTNP